MYCGTNHLAKQVIRDYLLVLTNKLQNRPFLTNSLLKFLFRNNLFIATVIPSQHLIKP